MPESQKGIYNLTAESLSSIRSSPFLARLKKKGYDDLLMTDLIGAYAVTQFKEFEGQKLICVSRRVSSFRARRRPLRGREEELRRAHQDRQGHSRRQANVERIMKAQVLRDSNMSQYMASKKTLELNAHNAIVKKLPSKASQDQSDPTPPDFAGRLNNLISFGSSIDDAGVEDNAAERSKKDGAAAEGAGESAMESID
ncbi:hypothetical protein A4X13_0g8564 [Tilletia indica]|uniref:Uncharacterized protein n=1 Tax=Tilletia indica TaxID=43049 RepID=A0A8T8SE09_9BASI|nr:hypothetical protein A4X13_0g8564 [Tilletia indica]